MTLFYHVGKSAPDIVNAVREITRAEHFLGTQFEIEFHDRGFVAISGDDKALVALRLIVKNMITECDDPNESHHDLRTRPCHQCEWYRGNRIVRDMYARCSRPNRVHARSYYCDLERRWASESDSCGIKGQFNFYAARLHSCASGCSLSR